MKHGCWKIVKNPRYYQYGFFDSDKRYYPLINIFSSIMFKEEWNVSIIDLDGLKITYYCNMKGKISNVRKRAMKVLKGNLLETKQFVDKVLEILE